VDTAYLFIYGRLPSTAEAKTALAAFPVDGKNRRMAVEDLFWALLNTPEFVFID
jgi:hypothetical protein